MTSGASKGVPPSIYIYIYIYIYIFLNYIVVSSSPLPIRPLSAFQNNVKMSLEIVVFYAAAPHPLRLPLPTIIGRCCSPLRSPFAPYSAALPLPSDPPPLLHRSSSAPYLHPPAPPLPRSCRPVPPFTKYLGAWMKNNVNMRVVSVAPWAVKTNPHHRLFQGCIIDTPIILPLQLRSEVGIYHLLHRTTIF